MAFQKKIGKYSIIFILLIALVPYTSAQPLEDALLKANDFFENEGYSRYINIIDFFLFFLISLSTLLIGVRVIFPDNKRHGNVIAMVIALIATISLVRKGVSIEGLLPYVGWFVFIGLVMFAYFFLVAIGMKEKRRWAFILAIIIAFIIFILLGWLFNSDAENLWQAFTNTIYQFGLFDTT
ncbi:MAG: hypothetical protein QF436_03725 [Candidatus Woesearchaeota archaeon]|jgi:hypothetical protein|nr:hypothetical protein [Candidatus Woesearchaeota archaeon]MDP7623197.1 hypothetical protein [Candidatus Woesearchaeota archaeon]HJN56816.1 hypothetical protein [Candidatus Woesearchaeota archaeon]|tara:strand:+ start:25763 stop:26305 length:543 start_codon:yes stop_codon:yes gene_type:complete